MSLKGHSKPIGKTHWEGQAEAGGRRVSRQAYLLRLGPGFVGREGLDFRVRLEVSSHRPSSPLLFDFRKLYEL